RNIAADVPREIYGNRSALHDILQKLVLNAYQYTDGGIISIDVSRAGGTDASVLLEFQASDTGAGMTRSELETVLGSVADGRHGQGLAAVQQAVARLGGRLSAHSTPGVSSTFSFTLPFQLGAVE